MTRKLKLLADDLEGIVNELRFLAATDPTVPSPPARRATALDDTLSMLLLPIWPLSALLGFLGCLAGLQTLEHLQAKLVADLPFTSRED
jgi:hypothetical protein